MGSRRVLGGLFVLSVCVGAAVACSNYEPPDVANYGPPNGIDGKTPNSPSASGTSTPPSSGGDGGAASGGEGGTPAVSYACGAPIAQTTPCSVSWKADIYPKMVAGGTWNCAGTGACHASATQPVLAGDAHSFYTTLANYTGTTTNAPYASEPYLNPCSTDPAKSTFVCNTQATTPCGLAGMPLGQPIAAAGLTAISTWVACGAPEN
jgi:hypothetical protein